MALAVEQLELGPIGTNCYLVREDLGGRRGRRRSIPGSRAEIELSTRGGRGRGAPAILVTHGHSTTRRASPSSPRAPALPVSCRPAAGVFRASGRLPPGRPIRATRARMLLEGGETVEVAGISFWWSQVPGHSPGHLVVHADGRVFSGDVLFAGSVGRTDLPFGDWETLLESIRALVDRYPPETVVYSGHGPSDDARRPSSPQPVPRERAPRRVRVTVEDRAAAGTHDILPPSSLCGDG